jgi:hypothetical protein
MPPPGGGHEIPAGGHGLGIHRAENNTSNATPVSTTKAARSLSSLACWLTFRIAVAVSSLTPAWSSAA